MKTKIVAGLGNPGKEYENTPHSIGFEVVRSLAAELGFEWEQKKAYKCLMARGIFGGMNLILVQPMTFMNLSGEAVALVVSYSNATAADLIVVQDDIDLASGRLRIRKSGSCGGHNGVRNIIERLGSSAFARVKIGVGKERGNVIGHVLGKFDAATRQVMDKTVAKAVEAVKVALSEGCDAAMNKFNGWKIEEET